MLDFWVNEQQENGKPNFLEAPAQMIVSPAF